MEEPEKELDFFRRQWRKEVSQRRKSTSKSGKEDQHDSVPIPGRRGPSVPSQKLPPLSSHRSQSESSDIEADLEPRSFHDLEDKERLLKVGPDGKRGEASTSGPVSALDHYEKAVERESAGSLGDSVSLYRKAFKLDEGVQEAYRKKHFPPQSYLPKPSNSNPSNASPTVPNTAHHSLHGSGNRESIADLMRAFSCISIAPAAPETDLSDPEPCPVATIPEELLVAVFHYVTLKDVGGLSRLAQVCKRFAYLVVTEDSIWKRLAFNSKFGFTAMHYIYKCNLKGRALGELSPQLATLFEHAQLSIPDLTPKSYPTYRNQFRHRPRIRFDGCYISNVNYQRPGAAQTSQYTWTSSPIHIVTYYRYLRFFRDGTLISLLTTAEPPDVVYYLTKEHLHERHTGALPSAIMKEALPGRWRLTGPASFCLPTSEIDGKLFTEDGSSRRPGEYAREPSSLEDSMEEEGTVHVETQGVIPKYMWKMAFTMGSSGRKEGTRNNRLSWKGFWSYNRLTDDWGEFALKNDTPFYWSRVKSFAQ